jgi:monoamine oxidase
VSLDRRALLRAGGAALAGAMISGHSVASQEPADRGSDRIAVVGAGIGGLSAALTLHDAGYAPVIFEASDRTGDRMHSNSTTWANGQVSEWCAELIDSDHVIMRRLAARFGLALVDLIAALPPDSGDTLYFFDQYYRTADANEDFQPVYAVMQEQFAAVGEEYRHGR